MKFESTCSRTAISSLVCSACFTVSACGGGGGSPTPSPSPTPVSTAPRITSASSANVLENTTGSVYTATATDPQGDAITWDVFSGADAGSFTIDANSGELSLQTAPNFELPKDANADNVYEVFLRATAGGESDTISLRVNVLNDFEGTKVVRIANGFVDPVGMVSRADGLKFLVAQKNGQVFQVDGETGSVAELTFIQNNRRPGEVLAIHEYFFENNFVRGIFLLTHSVTEGLLLQAFNESDGSYRSYKLADPWAAPVKAAIYAPRNRNRSALHIAIGDPGGTLAQDASSGYGKLFNMVLGDPYAGAGIRTASTVNNRFFIFDIEQVGDGIQSPSGGGIFFDQTMLVDQGSSISHEITLFQENWRPLDFGWPFYEGATTLRNDAPAAVNGPSLVYGFGDGRRQGVGIIAGVGYAGGIEGIEGHYVFGDRSGAIWSIPANTLNNGFRNGPEVIERRDEDFVPDVGAIDSPIAFGISFQRLFILDGDGDFFRVDER